MNRTKGSLTNNQSKLSQMVFSGDSLTIPEGIELISLCGIAAANNSNNGNVIILF
jgi:hypothetical protein